MSVSGISQKNDGILVLIICFNKQMQGFYPGDKSVIY